MQNKRHAILWILAVFGSVGPPLGAQSPQSHTPVVPSMDEKALREYAGAYRWGPNAFVYLQMWGEFSGSASESTRRV